MTREADPAPTEPPPTGVGGEAGHRGASRVTAGILLSRILGLVRERALGHFFGAGLQADAWRAALRLPNLLQNLLGEGTLSAAFIPRYAGMEEEGRREAAQRFAGSIFGLLFLTAGVLVLLGMAFAPWIVAVLLAGFDGEQQARTVGLVRILFPMTGILVLSAWTLGILNTHRRFFLPYVAPVFWNLAIIGALAGGGWLLGWEGDVLLRAVAWGALVGGGLQLGVQLPGALRLLGGFRPSLSTRVEGVRGALRAFGPVVAGRGAVNLGGYADLFLASFLATGAVAVLGYAQVLYMLPISLFGMAVAASELPEMSRREAVRRREGARTGAELSGPEGAALAGSLAKGMRRVAWFLVPASAIYLFLGDVVVAALYQTGGFGAGEVRLTGFVLGAYALGMGASATSRFLSSAYYALGDTRTPAVAAAIRVALALALGAALMFPLDRIEVGAATAGEGVLRLGALALALGTAVGAWVEHGLLRRRLSARVGPHGPGAGYLGRLALASAGSVGAGWGIRMAVAGLGEALHPVAEAFLVLGGAGLGYLLLVHLLGIPGPSRGLLGRIRGRSAGGDGGSSSGAGAGSGVGRGEGEGEGSP